MIPYSIFIDDVQMPVTPDAITTTINNQNETINLINSEEYNMLRHPGLTDIEMTLLLPAYKDSYMTTWQAQQSYLDLFEALKTDEKRRVFSVMIIRSDTMPELSDTYFEYASLEDYKINETAGEYGIGDIYVPIKIKKFNPIKSEEINVEESSDGGLKMTSKPQAPNPVITEQSTTVKPNETLYELAQRTTGNGENYVTLAALNDIDNPNFLEVGSKIRLR